MNYLILILLLMTSFSLYSAPTCSKNGTRAIYTNGIATKDTKALRDMELINN